MGLPEPGQAAGGLGLGPALVALAHQPGRAGMSVGGSRPSGGAGPTRWGKGGAQNRGQEELIRRQPRRARGHNRAEGPPGPAPSLPRINREERKGRGLALGEESWELSRMALPPLAQLATYLASGWEAGGSGSLGRCPPASYRVALSSLCGTYIGRMIGQGGEKGPSHLSGK